LDPPQSSNAGRLGQPFLGFLIGWNHSEIHPENWTRWINPYSAFMVKNEVGYILRNRMEETGKVNLNRSVGG